nr:unnamed protein product [Callosobruchus chinensis]CAI5847365.1 unnamed protein product [Callosobruchus analis]CAI5861318.1 unnamed protein product [Callosobruchus analis]
MQTTRLC